VKPLARGASEGNDMGWKTVLLILVLGGAIFWSRYRWEGWTIKKEGGKWVMIRKSKKQD